MARTSIVTSLAPALALAGLLSCAGAPPAGVGGLPAVSAPPETRESPTASAPGPVLLGERTPELRPPRPAAQLPRSQEEAMPSLLLDDRSDTLSAALFGARVEDGDLPEVEIPEPDPVDPVAAPASPERFTGLD